MDVRMRRNMERMRRWSVMATLLTQWAHRYTDKARVGSAA
jgi:hypothetical protein